MTPASVIKRVHPYSIYEGTPTWKMVDSAINDLIKNGDVIEQTSHDYVVGYLCKAFAEGAEN